MLEVFGEEGEVGTGRYERHLCGVLGDDGVCRGLSRMKGMRVRRCCSFGPDAGSRACEITWRKFAALFVRGREARADR